MRLLMSFCTLSALMMLSLGSQGLAAPKAEAKKDPIVVLETNKGKIVIKFYADAAPISVKNMLAYVDAGFYNGTVFHRVIPGFMIQGGGFTVDLQQKETRAPIKNEATNGKRNKRGTVAMARTGVVDSATSQFFINVVDNAFLDHRGKDPTEYGYAVVGEVMEGMDVVDTIAKVSTETLPTGMQNVPTQPVIILKAFRK